MREFESFLAPYLEEYIAYRQGLGYTVERLLTSLRRFDRFVTMQRSLDWDNFSSEYFLDFKKSLDLDPLTINHTISIVRGFFHFLQRKELITSNPVQDIPACREHVFIPYVFSLQQVELLLKAIQSQIRKNESYFLQDLGVYLAIMLCARCGLRISEPLHLQQRNYRERDGTIYIENTKFKKDRLIPVPQAVQEELNNYLSVRKSLQPKNGNPYLLVKHREYRLWPEDIYTVFHRVIKECKLAAERCIVGNTCFGVPTMHSFRHSFAINTLKQARARGLSPQYVLPILAAYMGHRSYCYTAIYLKVIDAEHRQALVDFAIRER
jgi:integrase/recombinase XerD